MRRDAVRLDLVIATCALLVSSLATLASWWQTRAMAQQTALIGQQLSATVWPFVAVSESLDGNTVSLSIVNDGLGPAVLRSVSASFHGAPEHSAIELLHAMLGTHIMARIPHGEHDAFHFSSSSAGSALRPGVTEALFTFTSKTFAPRYVRSAPAITIRTCYCAIVPGTCWSTDTGRGDPVAVTACREVPDDWLHSSATSVLLGPL